MKTYIQCKTLSQSESRRVTALLLKAILFKLLPVHLYLLLLLLESSEQTVPKCNSYQELHHLLSVIRFAPGIHAFKKFSNNFVLIQLISKQTQKKCFELYF